MLRTMIIELRKILGLLTVFSLSYWVLFTINAGGLWFIISLIENDVGVSFFIQVAVIIFVLKIIAGVVNTYCGNIAEGHFQRLRQIKYRNFNKAMLSFKFLLYDDSKFRARIRQAAGFLSSNISGFEAVLKNSFNFIPIAVVTIVSGIMLGIGNIIVLLICVLLNFVKYFAVSKERDFEIENLLEKGHNANKLKYYRNISMDYQFGKDIRLYKLEGFILKKYSKVVKNIKKLLNKQVKVQNKWGIIATLTSLASDIAFYGIIFFLIMNNHLEFAAVFLLMGLYEVFSHNYSELLEIIAGIKKDSELYNIFSDFMEKNETSGNVPENNSPTREPCIIQFKDVSFKYLNSTDYVLKNVNLSFSTDDRIGLIGENGAGKTTFIKLLMGLYIPTSGEICINGINAQSDELRNLSASVFQESDLFAMTLFENIFPGDYEDCNSAHNNTRVLESFLEAFDLTKYFYRDGKLFNPMMLKNLDKEGFVPSGGVKQKLLFIRALVQPQSKFLILDEPTSSLDARSEAALYSTLSETSKDKGFIIISHRLAVSNIVKRIIVLSRGSVVADGCHDELLLKSDEYRLLYEAGRSMYSN